MGIGLRKLALVGAALLAGGFAVAGDALAQGGPTTQSFPTTRPLGHPGARPPGVRPPGVRPPVARPPITNPGFPGRRTAGIGAIVRRTIARRWCARARTAWFNIASCGRPMGRSAARFASATDAIGS